MNWLRASTRSVDLLVGHINCNGLYKKLDQVKLLLHETNFDISAIKESHFSNDVHDCELYIENYNIVCIDRDDGVVLLCTTRKD